jgi:hypothetical protein
MIIPKELKEKWVVLRSHGDAAKIVALASEEGIECSDETVNRALRQGKCNDDLFRMIAAFYADKAEMVKAALQVSAK